MHNSKQVTSLLLTLAALFFPVAAMTGDLDTDKEIAGSLIEPSHAKPLKSPSGKTREELFLEIFKRPALIIPMRSYIFLTVNEGGSQKVKALVSQGGLDLLIEGSPVIAALSEQFLLPSILQSLERKIDSEGWLHRTVLEENGISTLYDAKQFEFLVTMPAKMRTQQIKYLSAPMVNPFTVNSIRPAAISTFVNFNLKTEVTSNKENAATSNTAQIGFSADGAVNLKGVVVEGSTYGQIGNESSLQRGDIRLVYDQPQNALRYTLGDLNYPTMGYQDSVNMVGIGVSKNFSLQPHVRTYRTEHFEFFLDHPSLVEVWVNQKLTNTLKLDEGSHDIRGLTQITGPNDIQIIIEDKSGRKEILHFSYIFDPLLLKKGKSQFSYNAGFRTEKKNGAYYYDAKKPVLSASYRLGFSDDMTLGVYAQADTSLSVVGATSTHALPVGKIEVGTAASRSGFGKQGVGANIGWRQSYKKNDGRYIQSQVSAQYLSKHFNSIDSAGAAPVTKHNVVHINAALTLPFGKSLSARFSADYEPTRESGKANSNRLNASLAFPIGNSIAANVSASFQGQSKPDKGNSSRLAASLSRKWGKYTNVRASLRRFRSEDQLTQTEVLFGISFKFSNNMGDFSVTKGIGSNSLVSTWNHKGERIEQSASTTLATDNIAYMGELGYKGSLAVSSVSYNGSQIKNNTGTTSENKIKLHLQSSLVFADGAFAVSPPVASNFVIVKGREGLTDIPMIIDPYGSGKSRAKSSSISPAVHPHIQSYKLQDFTVEPIDPPIGATPQKMTFSVLGTYKGGFLLEVGKERTLFAIGRLVDNQQAPLANIPIEIRRLGHLNEKPVSTFTSRSGRFQMPEIKSGQYEIRPMSDAQWGSVIVDIPETEKDIYRLGDLVVQP
jgi:outer membrane usher protein